MNKETVITAAVRKKLRKAIDKNISPAHCPGCDEWGCGGDEYGNEQNVDDILEAVCSIIAARCKVMNDAART